MQAYQSFIKNGIFRFVLSMSLGGFVVMLVACRADPTITLSSPIGASTSIEYVGRVLDSSTGEAISGAKVTFKFDSQGVPCIDYTDSEGVYRFSINVNGEKVSGFVNVDAANYEKYDRNITLYTNLLGTEDIRLASLVSTPLLIPPPTPLPTNTSLASAQSICYYGNGDEGDEAVLRRLIELEGEALSQKDISIIDGIFASNAFIGDVSNKIFWVDPFSRYQALFDSIQSAQVTHTDVRPVDRGILGDIAWFTSGNITHLKLLDGNEVVYENQFGSDHWTFTKNDQGCWIVASLVFNAGMFNFPCYCDKTNNDESVRCLIDSESQAVADENPLLIWAIFSPDAVIQDGNLLLSADPLNFYNAERFQKYDYVAPQHFEVTKVEIESGEAFYISGSRGTYYTSDGAEFRYDNPAPGTQWHFQRDPAGCWRIARFAFNQ